MTSRLAPDTPWQEREIVFRAEVGKSGWVSYDEYLVVERTDKGAWLRLIDRKAKWAQALFGQETEEDDRDPLVAVAEDAGKLVKDDECLWRRWTSCFARRDKQHALWDLYLRVNDDYRKAKKDLAKAKRARLHTLSALETAVFALSDAATIRTKVLDGVFQHWDLVQLYFDKKQVTIKYDPEGTVQVVSAGEPR